MIKYPLHLEKANRDIFLKSFKRTSKKIIRELKRILNVSMVTDSCIYNIRKREDQNYDKSYIIELLDKIIEEAKKTKDFKIFEKSFEMNFKQVDMWNQRLILPFIRNKYYKGFNIADISLKDIFSDKVTKEAIENRVRLNVELIKTIDSEYFDKIEKVVSESIDNGYDLRTTTDKIIEATQIEEKRAKFWGRDQVSKTMGEIARLRQLEAGFDGFIWRTVQDGRVRDKHQKLNKQAFSWSKGAVGKLTKSSMRFPGDDYQCRCYADPVDLEDVKPLNTPLDESKVNSVSYDNLKGKVVKPKNLRSKEEFDKYNNLTGVDKQKSSYKYERESIYYWLEGLGASEIRKMVKKAQNSSEWIPEKLGEHINKDYRHEFIKGENSLSSDDRDSLVNSKNKNLLDYGKVAQFVKNNFTSVHFKRKWSENKQIVFYEKNLDAIVIVDVTNEKDYKIMTLHKNTEKEKNFKNTIKVDSMEEMYEGIPLKQAIREGLTYFKNIKNDCVDDDIVYLLYGLMEANGKYPEYDIEYLETFDIEALVNYTWSYYYENDLDKSWHFFVYNIKEGTYPLERLPLHVRDILKKRYYKNK